MMHQVLEGDNLFQNRPNSGSEGRECPAMEHRRSKVGPVLKEHKNADINPFTEQTQMLNQIVAGNSKENEANSAKHAHGQQPREQHEEPQE
eukprot:4094876-Ditylum_brightwellii.AAC.1